ncbi:MAG: 16S rRNA (cytosine(967)-C(5))-methyltransferase RsmB [Gammaproteobacteria bacterium]|nr:16S rRNA (cytosine(967)-C(5))-methyltransferase RsmB [Gammaproteobacteria bacterium]
MAKTKQKQSARASAARIIAEVLQQHRSLNGVLTKTLIMLPENERSLCQQLSYGVLRWQPQLQAIADQLLKKRLKKKDGDISALLLCGLYQLRAMRVPEHAAISETVNACKTLGKQWATGLINASLRNYQREKVTLESSALQQDSAKYAHPTWLIERFKLDWPDLWQALLNANNQQPPMMLRINQQHGSREHYLQQLQQANITAEALKQASHGVLLETPCDVYQLPGFEQGEVSVQDGAAQLVVDLLDIKTNQRILDACAAPGGKTCHILETQPNNDVIALDIDPNRLQQIKQNTDRLNLNATLIAADAGNVSLWWNGQKFDRILIDAPCSGTGVIRRHPDIKVLRRPEDIANLVEKQQQLLENLWPLLNTDGLLVYTTCSALKQENEQQIMDFLKRHPEAQEQPATDPPASRATIGYQRLPGDDNMDGFYYVCLRHR